MSDEDDICQNYHGGNEESFEAHAETEGHKERDARAIESYVRNQGKEGATCDEIESVLGLAHQTASARCSELLKDGRLVRKYLGRVKVRRLTRRGCWAAVLILPNGKLVQASLFD